MLDRSFVSITADREHLANDHEETHEEYMERDFPGSHSRGVVVATVILDLAETSLQAPVMAVVGRRGAVRISVGMVVAAPEELWHGKSHENHENSRHDRGHVLRVIFVLHFVPDGIHFLKRKQGTGAHVRDAQYDVDTSFSTLSTLGCDFSTFASVMLPRSFVGGRKSFSAFVSSSCCGRSWRLSW